MSSDAPPPTPDPVGRYTLDDAVVALLELVDLTTLGNDLQRATQAILLSGAPPYALPLPPGGGPAPPPGPRPPPPPGHPPGAPWPPPGGYPPPTPPHGTPPHRRDPGPSIAGGIGKWAKFKVRKMFRGSRIHRWKWAGKRAGAGLGRSLGMGARGVQALGAVGGAAGALGGFVVLIATLATALIKARDAVNQWTEEVFANARRLAQVSGSMAGVMAERDVRQMMRDVKRGEATAGSANKLMLSEDRRKQEENRIGIVVDNAKNTVLTWLNDALSSVIKPIADGIEFLAKKAGLVPDEVPVGGLAGTLDKALEQSQKIEASGRNLMDIARQAAAQAGGPGTSSPPSMLP